MAIKLFHSGQAGAPNLRGQNGSLITMMDAVLVDGYNTVSVSSIVRVGTTATATTAVAHGLLTGDSALVSGAVETDYNIEAVVTVLTSTTFTYTVANAPATPATGTIFVKRAPAGFAKAFSGTNKAAYRSNDVTGTRPYLQIIDDGTLAGGGREAKTRGYLTMSDVDTGSEPFPTIGQYANGLVTYKSGTADATNRPWVLITDGKVFYLQACMDQSPTSLQASGGYLWWLAFGDILSTRPSDPYKAFLAANSVANQMTSGSPASNSNGFMLPAVRTATPTGPSCYIVRSFTQVSGAVIMNQLGHGWDQTALGSLNIFTNPHPPDNGFMVTPVTCMQGGVRRGKMPGVYEPMQGRVLNQFDTVEDIDGLSGRKLICLWGQNASAASTTGSLLFDLTGPWS